MDFWWATQLTAETHKALIKLKSSSREQKQQEKKKNLMSISWQRQYTVDVMLGLQWNVFFGHDIIQWWLC